MDKLKLLKPPQYKIEWGSFITYAFDFEEMQQKVKGFGFGWDYVYEFNDPQYNKKRWMLYRHIGFDCLEVTEL